MTAEQQTSVERPHLSLVILFRGDGDRLCHHSLRFSPAELNEVKRVYNHAIAHPAVPVSQELAFVMMLHQQHASTVSVDLTRLPVLEQYLSLGHYHALKDQVQALVC